ncbi:MAG: VTT domain-containing protein [Elusimicrobia bacterium]|nr:VTT domain-containing protein [Elusimicrobiota bacterium]
MIAEMTQWILELLRTHGSVSVFIGVIIESVIVPIPSPLIIMGAGAILIAPDIGWGAASFDILKLIVFPATVASTLGAYIGYGIGFWGGKPMIEKLEKFLGFGWQDVMNMERRFQGRRMGWTIFLLRALPIVPLSLISAAAGVIRLPVWAFTWWTFLGSVPRCLFLGYLGWILHDAYYAMANKLNFVESLVSVGIVAGAGLLVLWLRFRMSGPKKT